MDIPDCMTAKEITSVTTDNKHLSRLSNNVKCGWPSTRPEVQKDLQQEWSFRKRNYYN